MLRPRLLAAGCGITLLAGVAPATAATITVNTTFDDTNQGDGQCSLRKAIADVDSPGSSQTDCAPAAFGANTIVLGAQTYTLGFSSSDELTISPTVIDLTIQGAGVGSTTINAGNLENRVLAIPVGASVTVEDLTITGASAPAGTPGTASGPAGGAGQSGGAILNQGALTLSGAAITGSRAGGGGLGRAGASANSGSGGSGGAGGGGGSGGAIYNTGTLTLTQSTLSSDQAGAGGAGGAGGQGSSGGGAGGDGGPGGIGGAIENAGGSVTITGSTIRGSDAGAGGAAGNGGASAGAGGGAGGKGGAGGAGGGLETDGGSLSVTNSTFASDNAGAGGAGGAGGPGATIGGAGGSGGDGGNGGALAASKPQSATLLDVTVAGSGSGPGGAAGLGGGGASQPGGAGSAGATGTAGGVFDAGSSVTLQNSLLALNAGGNCGGSILDGGHNLSFGDTTCAGTFLNGDPKLGALQDNGGPTQTIGLGSGSAAIDQIPASGAGCPAADQREVARPSGTKCDIGSYEVAPPVAVTTAAQKVTLTSALLTANVTPNAGAASVAFQFGQTPAYGSTTRVRQVGGVTSVGITAFLSHLAADTTYHYRVVVVTPDGTSVGADRTLTTSVAVLTRLKLSPSAFQSVRGAAITYSDSVAAITTLAVLRCARVHGARICRTFVEKFTHHDGPGFNRVRLSGRVHGRPLAPGVYALDATPAEHGTIGRTQRVTFRVL